MGGMGRGVKWEREMEVGRVDRMRVY
jgi:hypothetical protein